MANFGIYKDNPTAGATDGTKISEGSGATPLSATLDATKSEVQIIKCALRCDDGYSIQTYTTVWFTGDSADKWKVSTDGEDWQDEIVLENVTSVNKVFWVKASSSDGESSNDSSVKIHAKGKPVRG